MAKIGRPTVFTEQVLKQIIEHISQGGSEYSYFCQEGTPSWSAWTLYKINNPEFMANSYARAKAACNEVWEHKIMERSLDDSRDLQPDGKGGFKSDNTSVNRDRLITDNMRWLMRVREPRKYSDKQQLDVEGNVNLEIAVIYKPKEG